MIMSSRASTADLETILEGPNSPFGIRFTEPDPSAIKRATSRLRRFAAKRIRGDAPSASL